MPYEEKTDADRQCDKWRLHVEQNYGVSIICVVWKSVKVGKAWSDFALPYELTLSNKIIKTMIVSERLRGLYYMMSEALSYSWYSVSPLTRRLIALGIISEMRTVIENLENLNQKLEIELSVEDADIDFDLWLGDTSNIQHIFLKEAYVESDYDDGTINKIPDLFPLSKSITFKDKTVDSLKTGMRQLGCEAVLNHADIRSALVNGFGRIVCLLREINEKMTDISDDLYENYCYDFFSHDLDYIYEEARRGYLLWKDEHEWKTQQTLEDKRTQEIVKLLSSGIFIHSIQPTNREIKECSIQIQEEALEHNTILPDNIDIECAKFDKYVKMKKCIMSFDYVKLGKYLYKHHKDIDLEQQFSLKLFNMILNFIQNDMAHLNPQLLELLPDYEENKLEEVLGNAINIINTCKKYLAKNNPDDFLESYLRAAFYGDIKQEVQSKLSKASVYTQISKILGMLKASMRVFKIDTSSDNLATCLSVLTEKPSKDSMKRKIDEGAADKNSKLRTWTDNYIKDHFYSSSERLFMGLSNKQHNP